MSSELEIPKSTVGKWIENYKDNGMDAIIGSGNLNEEKQADRELQKKVRDLEEENKILKKVMLIFTNDQK